MSALPSNPKFDLPVSLRIRCSPSQAFEAWIKPELAQAWLCDEMLGQSIPGEIVSWRHGEHRQEIRISSIETNRRLTFQWQAWGSQPETNVDVEFEQLEGETAIRIKESGWSLNSDNVTIALDHACGWENVLCRLKAYLEVGALFSGSTGSFHLAGEKVPTSITSGKITLRIATVEDPKTILTVFQKSPTYFERVDGVKPTAESVNKALADGPEKTVQSYKKIFLLIESGGIPIGVADLHKDHPEVGTTYLGLLLLTEDLHGKNLGRRCFELIEDYCVRELGTNSFRLGVSDDNDVSAYWMKMGFLANGKTYAWKGESKTTNVVEYEKAIPSIRIMYGHENYLKSFYSALDEVAKEQIYIEMIEAPSWERILGFHRKQVEKNWPVFYAIEGDKVVGWADISPSENPRLSHRGFLGMGLLQSHRGRGIGTKLLNASLSHARKIGLEKVELTVYTTNTSAIALYEKLGFQKIGFIKSYRKLNGQTFDCVEMERFLNEQ